MAHYSRYWNCERCDERQESMDWPDVAVCDRCERKAKRADEARAVRYAGAFLLARNPDEHAMARLCQDVADRLERDAR